MVDPHHLAHWYPTAAYLYVSWLDALALAWEYLRRHPDYRLDWLRRHRRPQAAQEAAHRWGLRLLEDPALDARDAHPAWLPGHAAVVQLYPDADPPLDAATFAFWRIPGHKQLFHDGKKLALIARSPGHCLRFALAPGLEDGMAVAYAQRAALPRLCAVMRAARPSLPPRPGQHLPRCWNCTPCRRSTRPSRARPCAMWAKDCSVPTLWPTGTATAACALRCAAWCGAAMR
jgi:hypothetical protein